MSENRTSGFAFHDVPLIAGKARVENKGCSVLLDAVRNTFSGRFFGGKMIAGTIPVSPASNN
jgi:hypothetical protein